MRCLEEKYIFGVVTIRAFLPKQSSPNGEVVNKCLGGMLRKTENFIRWVKHTKVVSHLLKLVID